MFWPIILLVSNRRVFLVLKIFFRSFFCVLEEMIFLKSKSVYNNFYLVFKNVSLNRKYAKVNAIFFGLLIELYEYSMNKATPLHHN
jgi:hypothetical protein